MKKVLLLPLVGALTLAMAPAAEAAVVPTSTSPAPR
jgi:hypothetical protein